MTSPAKPSGTNQERLRLRAAVMDDAEMVFGWRNLASIVEVGSLKREVSWVEHQRWFEDSLRGDKRHLFIILVDDEPAGQMRFDRAGPHTAELSLYLLPAFSGRGLGVQAIEDGCHHMWKTDCAKQIVAWVREDNARSLSAFCKAGFSPDATGARREGHVRLVLERRMAVPHNRLTFGTEEEQAVVRVVRSGRWAGGSVLEELERRLALEAGVAHAVGVGSGLGALRLSLLALGVVTGDQVAVPAYSCVALANAVLACGAEPVPVDVDPRTWNLSVSGLRETMARMPGIKAVIAVHTFGCPAAIVELESLGVPVVEDCSHAFGRPPLGRLGRVAMLSLYATKLLGAGEGGMVLTNDEKIAGQIRAARDYSDQGPGAWRLNDKMTDFEAALALCQLERLPDLLSRRDALAGRYTSLLATKAGEAGYTLPPPLEGRVWYRYAVTVDDAPAVIARMASRGIAATRPVEKWAVDVEAAPVSAGAYREIVSLPLYPTLTIEEQDCVVAAFLDAVRPHTSQ